MMKQKGRQNNQCNHDQGQFLRTFQSQKTSSRSGTKFVRKPQGSKLQRKKKINTNDTSLFCYFKLTQQSIKQEQKSFKHNRSDLHMNILDKIIPIVLQQKQNQIFPDEINLITHSKNINLITQSKPTSKQKNPLFRDTTNFSSKLQLMKRNRSQSMIIASSSTKKDIIKQSQKENEKIKAKKMMNNNNKTFIVNQKSKDLADKIKIIRNLSNDKMIDQQNNYNYKSLYNRAKVSTLIQDQNNSKQIDGLLQQLNKTRLQCSYYMKMLQQKNRQLALSNIKQKAMQNTNIQLQFQLNQLKAYTKQLQSSLTPASVLPETTSQLLQLREQLLQKYKHTHQLSQQNQQLHFEIDRLSKQLFHQKQHSYQLSNQLKYCQIQINMLNRIKLQMNNKNQQIIKIQNLNLILKNQLTQLRKIVTDKSKKQSNNKKNNKQYNQTSLLSINSINSLTSISQSLIGSEIIDNDGEKIQEIYTENYLEESSQQMLPLPITHVKSINSMKKYQTNQKKQKNISKNQRKQRNSQNIQKYR